MALRAKFKLERVDFNLQYRYDAEIPKEATIASLTFKPVYSEEPGSENRLFWDATPTGELRLDTINEEAWREVQIGKEYYLDITPAD